jgi:LPXTG-motif cell wall-anchored protein
VTEEFLLLVGAGAFAVTLFGLAWWLRRRRR